MSGTKKYNLGPITFRTNKQKAGRWYELFFGRITLCLYFNEIFRPYFKEHIMDTTYYQFGYFWVGIRD